MTSSSPKQTFFGLEINTSFNGESIKKLFLRRHLFIEFNEKEVLVLEAKIENEKIEVTYINSFNLPEDSVERGVPNNPEAMSIFLRQTLIENNIFSSRCYVVLPPDSLFSKIISLKGDFTRDELYESITKGKLKIQIPIPISQTDFDIYPITNKVNIEKEYSSYVVRCIPKNLVNNISQTINLAGLNLCGIENSCNAYSYSLLDKFDSLEEKELIIVVELLENCSYLSCGFNNGIFQIGKIPSIKSFPKIDSLNKKYQNLKSIEDELINKDNYFPLKKLDLKVFLSEFKSHLKDFLADYEGFKIKSVYLTGINSSHKDIDKLLESIIKIPVKVLRYEQHLNFGFINSNNPVLIQKFNRVLGNAIGSYLEFFFNLNKNDNKDEFKKFNEFRKENAEKIKRIFKDLKNTKSDFSPNETFEKFSYQIDNLKNKDIKDSLKDIYKKLVSKIKVAKKKGLKDTFKQIYNRISTKVIYFKNKKEKREKLLSKNLSIITEPPRLDDNKNLTDKKSPKAKNDRPQKLDLDLQEDNENLTDKKSSKSEDKESLTKNINDSESSLGELKLSDEN